MDLNQEIRSFIPIDIEKFSGNNEISAETLDSVKSYNKAIEFLKTGSEDIAMIELKKVVSSNPDFYEAVNLLGLCYAYTNQMDKAEELFGKVVQGENNVLKAADYLNYIITGDSNSSRKPGKYKNKKTVKKPAQAEKDAAVKTAFNEDEVKSEYLLFKKIGVQLKKPSIAVVLNIFSVIFLVTALIFFFMQSKDNIKADPGETEADDNIQQTEAYTKLEAENKSLKSQLENANVKLKQIQLGADLSQVSSLYGQKKYVEAADKLLGLPVNELNADQKKKYDSIKNDVLLKAANQLTNDGNTLYTNKKYLDAIQKLEKVFTFGDNWTFGDKALYILGKSYVEAGENQKGAEAYQKLIDQYPKSAYIKYAKSRLSSIS